MGVHVHSLGSVELVDEANRTVASAAGHVCDGDQRGVLRNRHRLPLRPVLGYRQNAGRRSRLAFGHASASPNSREVRLLGNRCALRSGWHPSLRLTRGEHDHTTSCEQTGPAHKALVPLHQKRSNLARVDRPIARSPDRLIARSPNSPTARSADSLIAR